MKRLILIFLIFVQLPLGAQVERLTVRGPDLRFNEIEALDLKDSFLFEPAALLSPGSELEHLFGLRSPILNAGAAAGSFGVYLGQHSFRSLGYGNTNIFLGAPYELLPAIIEKGPQSQSGPIVHGLTRYHSTPQTQQNKISTFTDATSRYRLQGNAQLSSNTHLHGLIDHSTGWREGSGFTQGKLHLHHNHKIGENSAQTKFYAYAIDQETSGYVNGLNSYRNRELVKKSRLKGAYRKAQGLHVQTQLELPRLTLTPLVRHHQMDFNMHWFPGQATEENQHTSLALLAQSSPKTLSRMNWDFLIDYTQGGLSEKQSAPSVGGFIQGDHYDYKTRTLLLSAHASIPFHFKNLVQITPGLRSSFIEHHYKNKIEDGIFGRYKRLADRSDDYLLLKPYILIERDFSTQTYLGLKLEQGGRSPEINDLYRQLSNQTDETIPAEKIQSLEITFKQNFYPLHLAITAYTMKKRNFYFRDSNANNVLGPTLHRGLEFDLTTAPDKLLSAGLHGSLSRHRYDFDREGEIQKGQPMDSSPSTSASAYVTLKPSKSFQSSLIAQYLGSYTIDTKNELNYPGHTLIHLGIASFLGSRQQYRLNLTVRNLFDRRFAERADAFQGTARYFPGRGRVFFFGGEYIF
jgi:iron complex outermembrane recepter protein